MSAARRRATPRRRPAPSPRSASSVVMVFWAGNFIVVKGALDDPAAGRRSRSCASRSASTILLALLRWREGRSGSRRANPPRSALLGVLGFGVYQILWTDGAPDDPGRRLGAAHRRDAGLHRADRGRDRLRHAHAGQARRRRGLVRRRGVVVARAPGSSSAARSSAIVLTLLAALCWAIYTAFGAPVLRRHSPLVPRPGRRSPARRPRADRRRPAAASGSRGDRRHAEPCSSPSSTRGPRRGHRQRRRLPRRPARSARPGSPPSSRWSRPWRSSSPRSSWASRSARARSSAARSSCVGVALTRRGVSGRGRTRGGPDAMAGDAAGRRAARPAARARARRRWPSSSTTTARSR